jgi:hypothetical protein
MQTALAQCKLPWRNVNSPGAMSVDIAVEEFAGASGNYASIGVFMTPLDLALR